MKLIRLAMFAMAAVVVLIPGTLSARPLNSGPSSAEISVSTETFAEDIRHEVENLIVEILDPAVSEWDIIDLKLPRTDKLPPNFELVKVILNGSQRGTKLAFSIEFIENDRIIRRLHGTAKVSLHANVVVSAMEISRGTLIRPELLTLEKRGVSLGKMTFCTDFAQLTGQAATRRIAAGREIEKGYVSMPPDVAAGEVVMIKAENQKIKVTAKGVARQDGVIGDVIQILNTRSNRKLQARVIGRSSVQVIF